jgi:hypothetical protein
LIVTQHPGDLFITIPSLERVQIRWVVPTKLHQLAAPDEGRQCRRTLLVTELIVAFRDHTSLALRFNEPGKPDRQSASKPAQAIEWHIGSSSLLERRLAPSPARPLRREVYRTFATRLSIIPM